MRTPIKILNKLEALDIRLRMQTAMEDTADKATQQQRDQLWQGLRSDGSEMPDYSFLSVFLYGKPPGPIKLYDQGDFYRGIQMDVRQDIFIMYSTDPKSTMLQNYYGRHILGLGVEAKNNYIVSLKPVFQKQIRNDLK